MNKEKEYFYCPPSPLPQLQSSFVWTIRCWLWQSSSTLGPVVTSTFSLAQPPCY